ncbi:hypothetical protein OEZ85_013721 [Tetradesmus obliquus]|uniref:Mediator of RNA polymerase II transcription subunit 13 n=1 Tax=Tetradesmus obliquus TaxID=3088 RepID=A0ABY8USM7_TETOB|nr:hypothetical protein OEZ85_013721 [Tetradesmus obliquus]
MRAGPATPAAAAAAAAAPEDAYQLPCAALRLSWPHPALLALLTQQGDCIFDAQLPALLPPGAAAAAAAAAAAGFSSSSSRGVATHLPAPQSAAEGGGPADDEAAADVKQQQQQQQQQRSAAASQAAGGRCLLRLACPQLLVGYQSEWLQVPPSYLPLWRRLGFSPASASKTLAYAVLAPAGDAAAVTAFMRDLSAMYAACQLGHMSPLSPQDNTPPAAAAATTGSSSSSKTSAAAAAAAAVGLSLPEAAAVIPRGAAEGPGNDNI